LNLTAQEENRISRAIAEESFIVALATWRDSAAMRTIAYVTLIFLPPTFVAVSSTSSLSECITD
jgi:Mg2+ and Co2+ transporter CorA